MPTLQCVSINASVSFTDGIDSQFMISVAIFKAGGLNTEVAVANLYGPVPDNFTSEMLLTFQTPGFTSDDVDGAILYMNHSERAPGAGGGNDNCEGTVFVIFTYSDSTLYKTAAYPFRIGNDNVSRDTSITIGPSHPPVIPRPRPVLPPGTPPHGNPP